MSSHVDMEKPSPLYTGLFDKHRDDTEDSILNNLLMPAGIPVVKTGSLGLSPQLASSGTAGTSISYCRLPSARSACGSVKSVCRLCRLCHLAR